MNKTVIFTTAVASMLFFSSFNGEGVAVPVSCIQPTEITHFCQDSSYIFNTVATHIMHDIDEEIDNLDEHRYEPTIFNNFVQTAEQLKYLIANKHFQKTPDVLTFNRGYIGLSWETNDDKTIFVYSLPEGRIFFHMVGDNDFSERFTIAAVPREFDNLVKKINALV